MAYDSGLHFHHAETLPSGSYVSDISLTATEDFMLYGLVLLIVGIVGVVMLIRLK